MKINKELLEKVIKIQSEHPPCKDFSYDMCQTNKFFVEMDNNLIIKFLKNICLDSRNNLADIATESFEYGFCLAMQYRDVLEIEEKFKTTA